MQAIRKRSGQTCRQARAQILVVQQTHRALRREAALTLGRKAECGLDMLGTRVRKVGKALKRCTQD